MPLTQEEIRQIEYYQSPEGALLGGMPPDLQARMDRVVAEDREVQRGTGNVLGVAGSQPQTDTEYYRWYDANKSKLFGVSKDITQIREAYQKQKEEAEKPKGKAGKDFVYVQPTGGVALSQTELEVLKEKSPEAYQAVKDKGLDRAFQQYAPEIEAVRPVAWERRIESELKNYKVEGGYNLTAIIKDKGETYARDMGFQESDIQEARSEKVTQVEDKTYLSALSATNNYRVRKLVDGEVKEFVDVDRWLRDNPTKQQTLRDLGIEESAIQKAVTDAQAPIRRQTAQESLWKAFIKVGADPYGKDSPERLNKILTDNPQLLTMPSKDVPAKEKRMPDKHLNEWVAEWVTIREADPEYSRLSNKRDFLEDMALQEYYRLYGKGRAVASGLLTGAKGFVPLATYENIRSGRWQDMTTLDKVASVSGDVGVGILDTLAIYSLVKALAIRTPKVSLPPGSGGLPKPLPLDAYKNIDAVKMGMSEAQKARFLEAKTANTYLTPEIFQQAENAGITIAGHVNKRELVNKIRELSGPPETFTAKTPLKQYENMSAYELKMTTSEYDRFIQAKKLNSYITPDVFKIADDAGLKVYVEKMTKEQFMEAIKKLGPRMKEQPLLQKAIEEEIGLKPRPTLESGLTEEQMKDFAIAKVLNPELTPDQFRLAEALHKDLSSWAKGRQFEEDFANLTKRITADQKTQEIKNMLAELELAQVGALRGLTPEYFAFLKAKQDEVGAMMREAIAMKAEEAKADRLQRIRSAARLGGNISQADAEWIIAESQRETARINKLAEQAAREIEELKTHPPLFHPAIIPPSKGTPPTPDNIPPKTQPKPLEQTPRSPDTVGTTTKVPPGKRQEEKPLIIAPPSTWERIQRQLEQELERVRQLQEAVKRALQTQIDNKTRTQLLQQTELLNKTETALQNQIATKTATQTKTQTKTALATQTQTATQTATKTATQTATKTATKTATQTKTKLALLPKLATTTALKTATQTATETPTRTTTKPATPKYIPTPKITKTPTGKVPTGRTPEEPTGKKPKPKKPKPPPRLRLPGRKTEKEEWTRKEIKSAIAWKQGVTIIALKSPYRRGIDEKVFSIKNVPKGLDILDLEGKGSPQATIQVTGTLKRPVTLDVGNQDAVITPTGKRKARLHFSRDTRGTVSQLTIKRKDTISRKRGRIYHTGRGANTVLSRRPLAGLYA